MDKEESLRAQSQKSPTGMNVEILPAAESASN